MKGDFFKAVKGGRLEDVKKYIAKGVDLDTQNEYGHTALMIASINGHPNIVKCLVEADADLNAKDTDGETALMRAVAYGNTAVVKYLVESGANLDTKDADGYTALMLASLKGHFDIVKCLVEAGANLDVKDRHGITALMLASINRNTDIVEYLEKMEKTPRQSFKKEDIIEQINLYSFYAKKVHTLYKAGIDVDSFLFEIESLVDLLLRRIYGEEIADKIIDYVNSDKKESIEDFVKNIYFKNK